MQGLGTLLLLLPAFLASRADHVSTLPDFQVQENFSESRVRLASLAEVATVVVCPCPWALQGKACLSWGVYPSSYLVDGISISRGPSWPDC